MRRTNNSNPQSSGFIVLDKPEGLSSMTAIAILRRKAGGVKTGHAGTLDPLATGVLVAALGKATKSIARIMDTTKRYETRIDLSAFTETDDREGAREDVPVPVPPSIETVDEVLDRFRGERLQRPPAYSAMKVGGRRAYQLARSGKAPSLEPRPVMAHEIRIRSYQWPFLELDLHVDKGFYVRSLARELGAQMETGGHCESIRRTAVGPFTLSMAHDPEQLDDPLPLDLLLDVPTAISMIGG